MKLLLTSRALPTPVTERAFLSLVGKGRRAVIITTAAAPHKAANRHAVALRKRLETLGFTVQFLDVELESAEPILRADAIFINGGNPYYLLYHLRNSSADELLQEAVKVGVVLVGISAGLLVLTPSLRLIDQLTPEMNTVGLTDLTGLELVPDYVLPHYDRFVKEGIIDSSVVTTFEQETGCEVIRLSEAGSLLYQSDGLRRRYRNF